MAQVARVKRLAYDAGWMRFGWPERVGGFAGSTLLRAYLGEALTARDLVEPGLYSMTEVLAPTMIDYAGPGAGRGHGARPPPGGRDVVPGLLRAGHREQPRRPVLSGGAHRPRVGGSPGRRSGPAWPSTHERCVLLTRTGTPDSAHRGITALFVDMGSPGITVRPIGTMHGSDEFSEVFFDEVAVPFDRTLGREGEGWAVAMDLLPYERSTSLWHRAAFLHRRLAELVDAAPPGSLDPARLGEVIQLLYAFRARSRATQYRMAAGERLGPETSIDKVLLATTRAGRVRPGRRRPRRPRSPWATTRTADRWRTEYLYSRAASIYGGSAEIQRNIIARRLLDLGNDR